MSSEQFHPITDALLTKTAQHMPHALVLHGPEGIGLSAAARRLTGAQKTRSITVLPERDGKVDIEKGTISIDVVRRLYEMSRTKVTEPRVFVIDYAERMGVPAQNAFLKLLEEPTPHTSFVLLTHDKDALLPTIQSRAQILELRPLESSQTGLLLDSLHVTDVTKRQQMIFMADGLPAELTRLAHDDDYFAGRVRFVRDARALLQATPYEGLKIAQEYAQDRIRTIELVQQALRQLRLALKPSMDVSARAATVDRIESFHDALERLQLNGHVKLTLAALVVK